MERMMNRWLTLASVCLWLGPSLPARAAGAEPAAIGAPSWCEAIWRGLNNADAAHGQSLPAYLDECRAPTANANGQTSVAQRARIRAYCRARGRDLRQSGLAGDRNSGQFVEQCLAALTPPGARVGDTVSASATAALLVAAAGVLAAGSQSGRSDAPASP